jgi:hypothetical protein
MWSFGYEDFISFLYAYRLRVGGTAGKGEGFAVMLTALHQE